MTMATVCRKPSRRLGAPEWAGCPHVSPDGKYLFFMRFDQDAAGAYAARVYWMEASGRVRTAAGVDPRHAAERDEMRVEEPLKMRAAFDKAEEIR